MSDKHYLLESYKKFCKKSPVVECCICGEIMERELAVNVPMMGDGEAHEDCYDKIYG